MRNHSYIEFSTATVALAFGFSIFALGLNGLMHPTSAPLIGTCLAGLVAGLLIVMVGLWSFARFLQAGLRGSAEDRELESFVCLAEQDSLSEAVVPQRFVTYNGQWFDLAKAVPIDANEPAAEELIRVRVPGSACCDETGELGPADASHITWDDLRRDLNLEDLEATDANATTAQRRRRTSSPWGTARTVRARRLSLADTCWDEVTFED